MFTYFTISNGDIFEFFIEIEDAKVGYHMGNCDDDIKYLIRERPYIREQLDNLSYEDMCFILTYYDCDYVENATTDEMQEFVLWLACGDIVENEYEMLKNS